MEPREITLRTRVLSPGIAIGRAFRVGAAQPATDKMADIDVTAEVQRFDSLVDEIAGELSRMLERFSGEIEAKDADIIQSQQLMISDQGFKNKVIGLIRAENIPVEAAVGRVMHDLADRMGSVADDYLRARANDFLDLARYFNTPSAGAIPETTIGPETILIVEELYPSVVMMCKKFAGAGILAEYGAPISHAAILARSFGIPVLAGTSSLIQGIQNGDSVILDAYASLAVLFPTPANIHRYQRLTRLKIDSHRDFQRIRNVPTQTRDGVTITLGVNVGRMDELYLFSPNEIDELGLFRTEFLFMFDQVDFPDFKQQVQWYNRVVTYMKGKPVTFRALDVGGDKFLPYFSMGTQSNPYLGLRAHRVFRYHPEILEIQLQAIVQASSLGPVRILFPMINNLEEIDFLIEIFARVKPGDSNIKVGIMVETPASVFMIEELLQKVDFISIGTNDLVQYTLTVDRNNENVMPFYQPLQPVVLRMLENVINTADQAGKPAAICGEIASDPRWTPLLLGLGIRALSMAPIFIPIIKKRILSLDLAQCRDLAQAALASPYLTDVKRCLDDSNMPAG